MCVNPKKCVGLGLFIAERWNLASFGKVIRNIYIKKGTLRIKWLHEAYRKHADIWSVQPRACDSWQWKTVLQVGTICSCKGECRNLPQSFASCTLKNFMLYQVRFADGGFCSWSPLIWSSLNVPKHSVIELDSWLKTGRCDLGLWIRGASRGPKAWSTCSLNAHSLLESGG